MKQNVEVKTKERRVRGEYRYLVLHPLLGEHLLQTPLSGSAYTIAPWRSGRGRTQQHRSNIAHPDAQEDEQHPSSSTSSSSNFENKSSRCYFMFHNEISTG
jgi:hypothetical protein